MARVFLKENALIHNLSLISKIAPLDRVYAVLKDNAYGHGLREFAMLCSKHGVKRAVVRNLEEALRISDLFREILCLAESTVYDANNCICYAANSVESLKKFPKNIKIHLKIDSGMHRCGIARGEIAAAYEYAIQNNIQIVGVFSHLKSADELSTESFWQEKNFLEIKKEVLDICGAKNVSAPIFHLQNSAGLFRSGGLGDFDAARVGIALYGYLDMPRAFGDIGLSPVASLWADKISSREILKHQRVGYGGVGKISCDSLVSVYDVGYADGFPRSKSSEDYVLPSNKSLVGRVSMDSICVVGADESICVFDDAAKLAKSYGTISYEILTRLNPSIPRVVT